MLRVGAAAFRYLNSAVQQQLTEMRQRLEALDHGMPTQRLDPARVRATRLGGRRESTFQSRPFQRFKELIRHSGGNVQPILVREAPGGAYEIVFGHRRHRACLELGLPVLAVVWQGEMSDVQLFAAMDAENRGRENPSAFDQGVSYAAALDAGLYPSRRKLADAIRVSHTWVNKALQVASLPEAVVQAFDDPGRIQPAHAKKIAAAVEVDREGVLRRAKALPSSAAGLRPAEVVNALLASDPVRTAATPLTHGQCPPWRCVLDAKGCGHITVEAEFATPALMEEIQLMIGLMLLTKALET
jgi:ParB family chromosome partitioning protein